jgi:hypothetical protein
MHSRVAAIYEPSPIKRGRRTKAEMEAFREAILEIIQVEITRSRLPMTVRQVFYRAEVNGLVEKEESGYDKVQRAVMLLRRSTRLPYWKIADNTRLQRKPTTFDSMADLLRVSGASYRQAVWTGIDCRIEIWCEKDALAGVIYQVTQEYDTPLLVARGYSSETFAHEAAMQIAAFWAEGIPTFVYHLADFDPSGAHAAHTLNNTLTLHAPAGSFEFQSLAVLPEQINLWQLSTRETKRSDTRHRWFREQWPEYKDVSCELDAIPPDILGQLVRDAIEQHLPPGWLEQIRFTESQEREWLKRMLETINQNGSSHE